VRSIQKFFTHSSVSTLDRVSFQLTDEHFFYGTALRENPTVAKTLDVGAKGWNSLVGGFTAAAAMVDRTRDSLVKRGQEMAGPSEEALAVNAPAAIIQPAAAGAAGAGAGADAIPTSTSPSGAGDDDGKPAPLLA
jgi:hypothetical protein